MKIKKVQIMENGMVAVLFDDNMIQFFENTKEPFIHSLHGAIRKSGSSKVIADEKDGKLFNFDTEFVKK